MHDDNALDQAVYLYNKHAVPVGYEAWTRLRRLVDWVAHNWNRPDDGVWESRGGARHHVFSKFMCWVALDRGLRLADKRSFPADRASWLLARDTIYEEVINGGRTSFLSAPELKGMLEGGVPILKDGQCLGAVGVSGVKSTEDAQIARAGIAAIGL